MTNFKLHWGLIVRAMLFSAAGFLVCSAALAQNPVNGFVIINPISVCSGSSCTPYGVSCTSTSGAPVCTKSPAPSLATVNTPIGFVDADTNINLTRAFWAQAGLDVVFFPVQSYNSPANTIPSSWNNIKDAVSGTTLTSGTGGNYLPTDYRTLHLVNVQCADTFVALTSPDFQALTQRPVCTEHGGLATAYQKLVNPPPAPSTTTTPFVPLAINGCSTDPTHPNCSPNSNAIDVFFVNSYLGPGALSPQYGFSWINGDGVSVQQAIFSTFPGPFPAPAAPRYDTLAHEIGHALGLTHANFGLPLADPTIINNLMQLGTLRATSYKTGCQGIPIPTNFIAGPPPVYNNSALYDLDLLTSNPCGDGRPLADQLILQPTNSTSVCSAPLDPTKCSSQVGAAALSPFINKTAPNTANAGGGQSLVANSAMTSTTSSTGTALVMTISASGDPNDPNVPDLASNIIALLPNDPISFNGNQPVTQVGGTPKTNDPTQPCDANHLMNCVVTIAGVTKLTNQQVTGNPGCDSGTGQPPSSQCIKIDYNPGFRPGDNIVLAIAFNKDSATIISNGLLQGAQYTSIDNTGYATTSLFVAVPVGATSPNFTGITANSQHPDLSTSNVLLTASTFQNAAAVNLGPILSKCTSDAYITVKIKGKLVQVCKDGQIPGCVVGGNCGPTQYGSD